MVRLQQRRVRFIVLAVLLAVTFLVYTRAPVTWPTTPQPDAVPATEPEKPRDIAPIDEPQAALNPFFIPPPLCVGYEQLQRKKEGPFSAGKRNFPYSRPSPECRTFNLTSLENLIERMKGVIKDPDLFRLFENSYPNTLDTCIKWRGYANSTDTDTGVSVMTDEELAFVITGDINAMWLRG